MRLKDTWTKHVPPEKLAAYKQLITEGIISNPHVVFARQEGVTLIEYDSDLSHEIVISELKKRMKGENNG